MNNIQNLHVVIPHINGEAVNHSATKRQPQSPLQNVSKLIAVQVVKILTPSKLWRLSTLDKAIPTSRRSGVTLRCTHSKQKCYSSVVTNTQQILATYKIYILSWKSVVETTPVIWIFRTSVPEGTPITIWTTVVTTTQKAVIWNDNIQNLHTVMT